MDAAIEFVLDLMQLLAISLLCVMLAAMIVAIIYAVWRTIRDY